MMVSMEIATRIALPRDNDYRDVQEDKSNDVIDGGLDAFLDLCNNEFEEEGMVDDNDNNKCDQNDNDHFYNQF